MNKEHLAPPQTAEAALDLCQTLGDDLLERGYTLLPNMDYGGLGRDYVGLTVTDLENNPVTWAQIIFDSHGWRIASRQDARGKQFIETVFRCFGVKPDAIEFTKWNAGREPSWVVSLTPEMIKKSPLLPPQG